MANKVEDLFIYKTITPSSLLNTNIIRFSYKSPDGVHDKEPLVYVTEKRFDRFFGINLNYDVKELQEAVLNVQNLITPYLEKEYFKKYPENKKKLQETKQTFNKSLITEDEYKEFMNRFPKKDLEVFNIQTTNMGAMRQYLYSRMTSVSKLVYKV